MKRQFECQILDKEKKNYLLWDSYKITLRIIETGEVVTWNVPQQQYYDMTIGTEGPFLNENRNTIS